MIFPLEDPELRELCRVVEISGNVNNIMIGGAWVAPDASETFEVVSPRSEEVLARIPAANEVDVDRAVAAAREAFDHGPWPRLTLEERIGHVARLADILERRREELAALSTEELGSPILFSQGYQAMQPAVSSRYFIEAARRFDYEEVRESEFGTSLVVHEPIGVVAAIVPFNIPLVLAIQKTVPALLSGCTVIIKPSPDAPLGCYGLAEAFIEAGFPEGVVSMLATTAQAGAHLVAHGGVDKVSFTGSTEIGSRIGEACGAAIKPVTLELGGKSAAIITEDADIDQAVAGILGVSIAANNGQGCTCQTRILVPRSRYEEVKGAFVDAVAALPIGDPFDPSNVVTPLSSERQRDRVEEYVALGLEEGATLAYGGKRPAGHDTGYYFEPTIFSDVTNDMRIAREEIFGPVVALLPYDTIDEAIDIANDSEFGLSGTVWTGDEKEGMRIARLIRTGTFCINTYAFDINAPFGGFKRSGIGRENGIEAIASFTVSKAITFPPGAKLPA